jgi:hypothetical protein
MHAMRIAAMGQMHHQGYLQQQQQQQMQQQNANMQMMGAAGGNGGMQQQMYQHQVEEGEGCLFGKVIALVANVCNLR